MYANEVMWVETFGAKFLAKTANLCTYWHSDSFLPDLWKTFVKQLWFTSYKVIILFFLCVGNLAFCHLASFKTLHILGPM